MKNKLILFIFLFLTINNLYSTCFVPVPGNPFPAGNTPNVVTFSPNGKFLAATNFNANGTTPSTISVYSVANNGSLTPVTGSPYTVGLNPNGLNYSPNGKFLAVASNGSFTDPNDPNNSVYIFSVAQNGSLTPVKGSPFLSSGYHLDVAFSPDGKFLALGAEFLTNAAIHVYNFNTDGSITEIINSPFNTPCVGGTIAYSLDGKYLYTNCINSNNPNSIIGYDANPDGSLRLLASSPFTTGQQPTDLALSKNTKFIASSNIVASNISVFQINADGSLTQVSSSPFTAPVGAISISFSPNNLQAVVASLSNNAVTFYDVNPITGFFSNPKIFNLLSSEQNPIKIRYSPNGLFVALANSSSNNISVYRVAITAIITNTKDNCAGTFTFTANSPDGVAPFKYAWTGPNGFVANTQSITTQDIGPYNVLITDANGCTGMATAFGGSNISQAIKAKYCN